MSGTAAPITATAMVTAPAPAPATRKTSPFILPELLANLGLFLTVQDLYSCVQVDQVWNTILVPFLWYRVDDRLFAWPAIVNRIHLSTATTQNDNTLQLHRLFEKYGHYIHHLSLSSVAILQAATVSTTCTQLRSLLVFGLKDCNPPVVTRELEETDSVGSSNNSPIAHPDSRSLQSLDPLLSPMFEGVFRPSQEVLGIPGKQRQFWRMVQLFWLLVRQNQLHLKSLHLEATVGRLFRMVSKEYLFDSLALLKGLRSLDTGLVQLDFLVLLDRVPSLCMLRSRLHDPFTKEIMFARQQHQKQSFIQIRSLELRDRLYLQEFFLFLRYLPHLEDIVFAGFMMQAGLPQSSQDIMDNKPSSLQGLHLRQIGKQDDKIIPGVLQWLPRLKRFGIPLLYPSIAKALRTYCQDLESFNDGGSDEQVVVIPPGVPITSTNTLNHLLQHCPKLRSVRAKRHTVMGNYVVKHSWACREIEELCFRLVGVRPDTMVQRSRSMARAESSGSVVAVVLDESASKEAQCRELHRRIKGRLSELRCLRIVDLGEEWAETATMCSV
ncbi:hypothetical protein BGX24_009298 [Mortierella sp. AD032]|nr:hypothetical protein BGX24_009298 [Mortierella sp. AD032]